jgi:hypothetical protein
MAVAFGQQPSDEFNSPSRGGNDFWGTLGWDVWYVFDPFTNSLASDQANLLGGMLEQADWDLFWDTVDTGEEQSFADETSQIVMGGAAVVTTAISVSYVLWTARGASALASLISSLPAWTLVDPLPILSTSEAPSDAVRKPSRRDESLHDIASQPSPSHQAKQQR